MVEKKYEKRICEECKEEMVCFQIELGNGETTTYCFCTNEDCDN